MGVNDTLSGGGKAGATTADTYALDKPYDLYGQPNADMIQQLDEMLTELFRRSVRVAGDVSTLNNTVNGGGGGGGGSITFSTTTGAVTINVEVSQTALEGASTTPVILVPAQGTKTVIAPVAWWPEIDLVTAYANNPSYSLAYAVSPAPTQVLATQLLGTNGAAPATKLLIGINNNPADHFITYGTTDVRNSALIFRSTGGDLTGGGQATAKIHLVYTVISTF